MPANALFILFSLKNIPKTKTINYTKFPRIKSLHLLKRKSLKITNSHRHITKSKHQLGIPMQTHDASLFPLKNTTRNTYLLLFLNILLKRLIHQFNVIRHGFIQINKFFHLSMGNNSHAIGIAVFCKILPGEQMGKDEIQFIQRGTYKQITTSQTGEEKEYPDHKWYYMFLRNRELKRYIEIFTGRRAVMINTRSGMKEERYFCFKVFSYTSADHKRRFERCPYSKEEYAARRESAFAVKEAFATGSVQKLNALTDEKEITGDGYLFVCAPLDELNLILAHLFPRQYLAKDRNSYSVSALCCAGTYNTTCDQDILSLPPSVTWLSDLA